MLKNSQAAQKGPAARRRPRAAREAYSLYVERAAEADRQLLRFLWESGIRPGVRLTVREVAPYAGTISVQLEGRTITMGLAASHKIWVYDPQEPEPKTRNRRPRAAKAGH